MYIVVCLLLTSFMLLFILFEVFQYSWPLGFIHALSLFKKTVSQDFPRFFSPNKLVFHMPMKYPRLYKHTIVCPSR